MSGVQLYPMRISPVCRPAIWGGNRMRLRFGFSSHDDNIAEAWVLSAFPGAEGTVQNGVYAGVTPSSLLTQHPEMIAVGNTDPTPPLLIKFIDARDALSVQVHPDDAYAMASSGNGARGKTEMWVVLEADEGATLVFGTKAPFVKEELHMAIANGTLSDMLNTVPVKAGDVFFIPAGMIHAIGGGILLCEVQQNSDTTYRIYDYQRRDDEGNARPLHIRDGVACARHYTVSEINALRYEKGDASCLADSAHFHVEKRTVLGVQGLCASGERFVSLIVTQGKGSLILGGTIYPLSAGISYFLPAGMGVYRVESACGVTLLLASP